MRDAWLALGFLQNINGRRASISVLAAVPLLVSLESSLQADPTGVSSALISGVTRVLEAAVTSVPINLMRAFWGAVAYLLSSLIFTVAFPIKLRTQDQWMASPQAQKYRNRRLARRPNMSSEQIDQELRQQWEQAEVKFLSLSTCAWLASLLLLCASAYFAVIIIVANAVKLHGACSLTKLLHWSISEC